MDEGLTEIARRYGLPDAVLKSMTAKAVISTAAIARSFEDEDQFVEFVVDEASGSLRIRLALKMVYFEALQHAKEKGEAPRRAAANSPDSSAPSREPSEPPDAQEDDPDSDEDNETNGTSAAPAPKAASEPNKALGPRWNP